MTLRHLLGSALFGLAWTLLFVGTASPQSKDPIRVGMVKTLFTDIPAPIVNLIVQPFGSLVKEFTGLDGQMVPGGDALSLAKDLQEGKIQLGVFHGHEFGWAQQKYPDLRPLMVAINKHKLLQAHIVVRKDSTVASFADLKGKNVAMPMRSKDHCRLFMEKNALLTAQTNAKDYFGQILKPGNMESALDDLCLGKFDSAIIDSVSLEFYNDLKPGCFARLKVIKDSEMFPPAVVAYRQGGLADTHLNKFRDGMVAANKSSRGREMMGMFKISSFEPIPEDYAHVLANIMKIYPSPESLNATFSTGGQ